MVYNLPEAHSNIWQVNRDNYLQYRAEIDGLRAFAVVPVVLFHAGFSAFGGGYVGVDIFFVISGYLITSIILSEMDKGSFSLLNFYERRARRILPALFLVLAACIPFAWIWFTPRDMTAFAESVAATIGFSSNILFWRESGYFDTTSELKPLLHTWSLAVEEQYYIAFPVLLMVAWRFGKSVILGLLGLIFVVSLAMAQASDSLMSASAAFYLPPTRVWELMMGAFAAFYFNRGLIVSTQKLVNELLGVIGLILIAASILLFDEATPFPSLYTLAPTLGTFLIIIFAAQDTLAGRLLSNRLFVGIGLISYSAYLWHQPLLAFARYRSATGPSLALILFLCVAAFLLAYLSWRFVEAPFRNKKAFDRKAIFGLAAAGSVIFLSFGLFGSISQGYPNRYAGMQKLSTETAVASPLRKDCHVEMWEYVAPSKSCTYHEGKISWVVFGDSHAVELAYALAETLKPSNIGLRHLSRSGCKPAYAKKNSDDLCARWTEGSIRYILETSELKNVVVTYKMSNIPTARERDVAWDSYIKILKALVEGGKNVHLVLQAPALRADVNQLIRFVPENENANVEGISLAQWKQQHKFVMDNLREIPSEVKVIDPSDLFCDKQSCFAILEGQSLYFDQNHISVAGATLVAEQILQKRRNTILP